MRISNQFIANRMLSDLERNLERMVRQQSQIASGKRLLVPSDDPVDSGAAIRFQNEIERITLFQGNLELGVNKLNVIDAALGDVNRMAVDLKSLVIEMADESTTSDMRASTASTVSEMLSELLHIANRKFDGQHLFAGRSTKTVPFTMEGGYVKYQGDTGKIEYEIARGIFEQVNLPGNEAFGALTTRVKGTEDLNPILTTDTQLADLRGGAGIAKGSIRIDDGLGTVSTVNLTGAKTIGDAIDLINDAAVGVTASIATSGSGSVLELTKGGADITVTEVDGGTTAAHLGILQSAAGATLTGTDLDPKMTKRTLLASLENGSGVSDLASGIVITNRDDSATISFAADTTIEDLLYRINNAGVHVEATINEAGTGIDVVSRLSGAELRIAENGGTTGSDLGILSFTGATLLADLNRGEGVSTLTGDDIRVTARDGTTVDVDLSSAASVQDVIDAINAAAPPGTVVASLGTSGSNGIRITDLTGGGGNLSVSELNGSPAALQLGIEKSVAAATLQGDDVHPAVAENLFTVLIDFRDALNADDTGAIDLAGQRLDDRFQEFLQVRGTVGGRAARLEATRIHLETHKMETERTLSLTSDIDVTRAITELNLSQITMTAVLQATAATLRTSLADFL